MNSLIIQRFVGLLKPFPRLLTSTNARLYSTESVEDEDMPLSNMRNPYQTEKKQCILCKYNIHVDYKNPRLLSQFVSPFTGFVYDKHITGLCEKQQRVLEKQIHKSRRSGFMPYINRDPRFVDDPKLFNPLRPQRPNPY